MKTLCLVLLCALTVPQAIGQSANAHIVVYVLFNNHIEGDGTALPGDPICPSDTMYQTLPLPPIGSPNLRASFAIDRFGAQLLRERTNLVTDSYGENPKWFQCPAGEFWQTEADPRYGGRLFSSINYLAAGDEFGIQGHAIYYSGQGFCWYPSPHTVEGIQWKFRDLHRFAESVYPVRKKARPLGGMKNIARVGFNALPELSNGVYFNGRKVNLGKTYTGGHKLESPVLGIARAEQLIDSVAYALGYRIAYEDHDGHVEDEPAGINNSRPAYFVYEAEYPNGVRIVKIDMNGSLNDGCAGNTPRCETSTEAIRRFDNTVAARLADPDTSRVYYFAVVDHANGYFAGKHAEVSGFPPRPGEYSALNRFLDSLQARIQAGVKVKFVTPSELANIFYQRRGKPTLPYQDSPFGFHPAGPPYNFAQDIGTRWTRGCNAPYLFWSLVDTAMTGDSSHFRWRGFTIGPNGQPTYFDYDALFAARDAGLNILQNIVVEPTPENNGTHSRSGSWIPLDTIAYCNFVKAAVRRYSFIRYWQVGNEPNIQPTRHLSGFADLQRITYEAIKEADPQAQVLIAGLAGNMGLIDINDPYFESVLPALAGKYMDIFDIHFYGDAKGGTLISDPQRRLLGYRDFKTVYTYFRNLLDQNGFSHVPIWVTEMGTFSGTVKMGPQTLTQTEAEQARDLLKRWVYPLSLGVKKVFWAFGLVEGLGPWDDDFFDHTGLIYGGQDGVHRPGEKKLGYYTHNLMTEKLEGGDWTAVETVREDTVNKIYVYKFTKGGNPIYVAWWDYFNDATYTPGKKTQIFLTGLQANTVFVTEAVPRFSAGAEVTDHTTAFRQDTLGVTNGAVMLTLGENPVFVEASSVTSVNKVADLPIRFELYQNYPNPFNPTTTIHFSLPPQGHVTLKVFDVLGREVTTLVNGELNSGEHWIPFNAQGLASGLYYCRLEAAGFARTKKMLIIR